MRRSLTIRLDKLEAKPAALTPEQQLAADTRQWFHWGYGLGPPPSPEFLAMLETRAAGPRGSELLNEKIRLAGLPEVDHVAELPLD